MIESVAGLTRSKEGQWTRIKLFSVKNPLKKKEIIYNDYSWFIFTLFDQMSLVYQTRFQETNLISRI